MLLLLLNDQCSNAQLNKYYSFVFGLVRTNSRAHCSMKQRAIITEQRPNKQTKKNGRVINK